MNSISKIFFCLLYTASAFGATDGGHVGGGGNPLPERDSAWFLGQDRTIHYCIEKSEGFGTSYEDAAKVIQGSFNRWEEYVANKKLNDRHNGEMVATTAALRPCDGTEDLKFYLGTQDDAVSIAKNGYDNPAGFSFRKSYSVSDGWGKGFVWIAASGTVHVPNSGLENWFPDWTKANALQALITHELGHVYGCAHVAGTIMTESISNSIQHPDNDNSANILIDIDGTTELVRKFGPEDQSYEIAQTPGWHDTLGFFSAMMGRDAVGKVSIKLIRPGSTDPTYYNWKSLVISDSVGNAVFAFDQQMSSFSFSNEDLFKVAIPKPIPGYSLYGSFSHETTLNQTQVKTLTQKKLWFTINWNGSLRAPVELSLLTEDRAIQIYLK